MAKLMKTLVFVCIIAIVGCKQTKNPSGKEEAVDIDTKELGFGKEGLDMIYHRFPSPEEMFSIFNKEKHEYRPGILNSHEKASEYLNSSSQALNLGVYSADLAYVTLFEKHNDASGYFEAIYDLSSELRISAAFDRELLRRVQGNLNNPDSLKTLSDFAFTKISSYLVSNNKEKVFAIISLGGFVEALYLSFNFAGDFSENNVIIQRIADQKLVLENILAYASSYDDDQAVKGAIQLVSQLRVIYNELVYVPGETKVSKSEDGKLIVSGGNKIVITEEQYNKLKDVTASVRKKITQN